MARSELPLARWPLFAIGLISFVTTLFLGALAVNYRPDIRLGALGILRIFGDGITRGALLGMAAMLAFATLAMFVRLFSSRVAAAIRHDGIELNGIFFSRYIPWSHVESIGLRHRRIQNNIQAYLRLESRCPPGRNPLHHFCASLSDGVSLRLIRAPEGEILAWVEQARAAWVSGKAPLAPASRGAGFGRRAT